MGTYRLECEFDVTRRIDWSDGDLGDHIDSVFDRLHQSDVVQAVDAQADLDTGRANISLIVSTFDDDPLHLACVVLGIAIRSCAAEHVGLLSMGEEGVLRPQRNQWSGLRTPSWRVRQIDFDDTSSGT